MGQTFFYDFLCESLVLVQIAFHQSYGLTEYARVAFDDTFDIFRGCKGSTFRCPHLFQIRIHDRRLFYSFVYCKSCILSVIFGVIHNSRN